MSVARVLKGRRFIWRANRGSPSAGLERRALLHRPLCHVSDEMDAASIHGHASQVLIRTETALNFPVVCGWVTQPLVR